jgi:hypothetical protein
MLQGFAPATDMIVSVQHSFEDRLMQSYLRSATVFRKTYRNCCLMKRPAGVIFEGICEHQPLWSDNFLIYASLSLDDQMLFTRGRLTAASVLLRGCGTSEGFDWITVTELGKDTG